jgi:hypothetical protein
MEYLPGSGRRKRPGALHGGDREHGTPGAGSLSIVAAGSYSRSTSNAAYSVPRCVGLFQVESDWIVVNGWFASGCTDQTPLLA